MICLGEYMRDRFARFMAGRNGTDNFTRFLLAVGLVLLLVSSFARDTAFGRLLAVLPVLVLVYAYFRIFSRNIYKRREENGKYLRIKYKLTNNYKVYKERWVQRRDYKFFTCPSCRSTMRVPRGKGKVRIVCRKCGTSFEGKT